MTEIVNAETPEKQELKKKKEELKSLERELAEKELFLSTMKGELHLFRDHYKRVVGAKCAELDDIKAKVLEFSCQLNPDSDIFKVRAEFARRQAQKSSFEMGEGEVREPEETRFTPSDEIKKLYRETARKIHPDLSENPEEREKRHSLMARLNEAYDQMDSEKIRVILQKWEDDLEPEDDLSTGMRLAKVLRQIARIKKRLAEIDDEWEDLKNSEMFRLKESMENSPNKGVDFLQDLADDIDAQIRTAREKVASLADEVNKL